jgi:hypothetical protein
MTKRAKALNYAGNRLLAHVSTGDARKCIACGRKQEQLVPQNGRRQAPGCFVGMNG